MLWVEVTLHKKLTTLDLWSVLRGEMFRVEIEKYEGKLQANKEKFKLGIPIKKFWMKIKLNVKSLNYLTAPEQNKGWKCS